MRKNALEKVKHRIDELIVLSPYPEEPFHSINTLEWLMKLKPDADDALQVAALGHDIERAIEDRKINASDYDTYDEYKEAHAQNSAQIMREIMEECGVGKDIIEDIVSLVTHHETGGDERVNILKDADVLSFFHVCLPLYYDRKGPEITRKRMVWGFRKLSPELRSLITGIDFVDDELRDLVEDSIGIFN